MLLNWLKVLRALQKADEIKGELDYCRKMNEKGSMFMQIW